MANLGGWHLVVILFIVLLLFGAPKLPGLARSLGQSMKILKKEVGPEGEAKKAAEATPSETAPSAPVDPAADAAQARAEADAAKEELAKLKAQAEERAKGE